MGNNLSREESGCMYVEREGLCSLLCCCVGAGGDGSGGGGVLANDGVDDVGCGGGGCLNG